MLSSWNEVIIIIIIIKKFIFRVLSIILYKRFLIVFLLIMGHR